MYKTWLLITLRILTQAYYTRNVKVAVFKVNYEPKLKLRNCLTFTTILLQLFKII